MHTVRNLWTLLCFCLGTLIWANAGTAGKDGAIYRYDRESGNWYQHGENGWDQVDPVKPEQQKADRGLDRAELQSRDRAQTQNLDKEFKARNQGEYRSQQYRNYSGSRNRASYGGRGGGRRR